MPHRFLHSQALAIAAAVLVLSGLLSGVLAGERVQASVAAVAGFGAAVALSVAEFRVVDYGLLREEYAVQGFVHAVRQRGGDDV